MTLHDAIELFRDHQKNSVRSKTRESYEHTLRNLEALLGDHVLDGISSQDRCYPSFLDLRIRRRKSRETS